MTRTAAAIGIGLRTLYDWAERIPAVGEIVKQQARGRIGPGTESSARGRRCAGKANTGQRCKFRGTQREGNRWFCKVHAKGEE